MGNREQLDHGVEILSTLGLRLLPRKGLSHPLSASKIQLGILFQSQPQSVV